MKELIGTAEWEKALAAMRARNYRKKKGGRRQK